MILAKYLLLLSGAAHAFVVPADQPNGLYAVVTQADGQDVHIPIDGLSNQEVVEVIAAHNITIPTTKPNLPARARSSSSFMSKKERRDVTDTVSCANYRLNEGDCDAAVNGLDNNCGDSKFLPPGTKFYYVAGSVVAYMCDFGRDGSTCSRGLIDDSNRRITSSCGLYVAGWRTQQGPTWWYSNGYENRGDGGFCG